MKPTAPGYWWYKFGKKPWIFVKVIDFNGRLGAWGGPDGPIYWIDEKENGWIEFIKEWVGPIQPPE